MSISSSAQSALAFLPLVQNLTIQTASTSNVLLLNVLESVSSGSQQMLSGFIKDHPSRGTVMEHGYTSERPPATMLRRK